MAKFDVTRDESAWKLSGTRCSRTITYELVSEGVVSALDLINALKELPPTIKVVSHKTRRQCRITAELVETRKATAKELLDDRVKAQKADADATSYREQAAAAEKLLTRLRSRSYEFHIAKAVEAETLKEVE